MTINLNWTGALTILFIVLKLTGMINWSWWWVMSPIWIGLSIFFVILAVVFSIHLLAEIL